MGKKSQYDNVPQEMKDTRQWLCWRKIDAGGGRMGKPPHDPKTGMRVAKNDKSKWVSFEEAIEAVKQYKFDGIGFVFYGDYVAIDLDSCFEDGVIIPRAAEVMSHFSSYAEKSPSGNGIHIFCKGVKNTDRTRNDNAGDGMHVEVYTDGFHFVTVTGDHMEGQSDECLDEQDALDWLVDTYLPRRETPDSIINREVDHGSLSPDQWLQEGLRLDRAFLSMWNRDNVDGDESSADFALMCKLAYWLNGDTLAMDSAFRRSPYYLNKDVVHMDKWTRREDYPRNTIQNAVRSTTATAAHDRVKLAEDSEQRDVAFSGVKLTDYTDMGNSNVLAERFGETLRFSPELGWCYFNGKVWETEREHRAMECAMLVADAMISTAEKGMADARRLLDAAGIDPDSKDGKVVLEPHARFLKHAIASRDNRRIKAMVLLATTLLHSDASEFDSDPFLFNTVGGVVDLRTCEILDHDPKYRHTNMSPITPDFDAPHPMFDKFLDTISHQDPEWVEYLWLQFGAASIGKTFSENLVMAYGTGANGKSTIFNIARALFGGYATAIDANLIMSRVPTEQERGMSMLVGKRLAIAQETDEYDRLSGSMLKRLCSTDNQIARRLYRNAQEFTPTHTLFLATNHLPRIDSTDEGTWRRIAILPFTAYIPEMQRVTDYHNKLIDAEGAAILGWFCEGAMEFLSRGMTIEKPRVVVEATMEYRSSEDWFARFLGDCCLDSKASKGLATAHADLYAEYQIWARDNGLKPITSIAFSKSIANAGYRKEKAPLPGSKNNKPVTFWHDIALIPRPTMVRMEPAKQQVTKPTSGRHKVSF